MIKKYIILFIMALISIAGVIGSVIYFGNKNKSVDANYYQVIDLSRDDDVSNEDILIVELGKKEEKEQEQNPEVKQEEKPKKETKPQEQPKKEEKMDSATLTDEIYKLNKVIGTLYIPKTKLNTSIYSNVNVKQLDKMPCFLYTTGGLNKVGTTLIVGHNRRNGKMFSNNKKLVVGDKFYFTDYEGKKLEYTIYKKFTTTESDISFLNDEVTSPVMALSCCTDASNDQRIIILGRAD